MGTHLRFCGFGKGPKVSWEQQKKSMVVSDQFFKSWEKERKKKFGINPRSGSFGICSPQSRFGTSKLRRGMELYEDEVRKMDPTEVQSFYLGFFKQLCVFRNF